MIKGFKYAVFFYSILPMMAYALAGGDYSFLADGSAFVKEYETNFSVCYICISILIIYYAVSFLSKKEKALNPLMVIEELIHVRSKSFIFAGIYFFTTSIVWINYFYVDRSVHWLDREEIKIFPDLVQFYINPIILFSILTNMAMISSRLVMAWGGKTTWKDGIRSRANTYFIIDLATFVALVESTGNRWYFVPLALIVFCMSSPQTKRWLFILLPVFLVVGAGLSAFIVALRVVADPIEMIQNVFGASGFREFFLMALVYSTEGVSFAALIDVTNVSLFSPDPVYFFEKIITMPFPGSMVVKPPPFNSLVAELIYGEMSDHSLNTTLIGGYIYGFGVLAILMILITLFLVKAFEVRFAHPSSNLSRACLFLVAIAAYRFNFEFLIVNGIYFYFLVFLLDKLLKKRYLNYTN